LPIAETKETQNISQGYKFKRLIQEATISESEGSAIDLAPEITPKNMNLSAPPKMQSKKTQAK
jgi:hypothetical protein